MNKILIKKYLEILVIYYTIFMYEFNFRGY